MFYWKAQINTKLDMQQAYALLRVMEGDQHKLPFQTRYGLFERTVLQFGMTNTPAEFCGNIHIAIHDAFHDFASTCMDDVTIYSDSEEEHAGHDQWIMHCVLDSRLYLESGKRVFHEESVRYLGLIISTKGISTDEDKVETG
jgi:hypothetical protein